MGIEGVTFFSKEEDEEKGCSIANYYEYKHEVLFYLKTILMEVKARDAEYQSLCQNLLEVLLINLMRRANISLKSSPVNKANKDCVYIEKYIDGHFKEDITLDTLSELTFLNKYHIVHAFKQYKGISPINYMIQKRIQEAKVLLSTTNLQISEIQANPILPKPSKRQRAFHLFNLEKIIVNNRKHIITFTSLLIIHLRILVSTSKTLNENSIE